MKKCIKCEEIKSLENFAKHKSSKDGLRGVCKECDKARIAASYLRNRENILKQSKIRFQANKEKLLAKSREYYHKRRSFWLCQKCDTVSLTQQCSTCREETNLSRRATRKERIAKGLCSKCGCDLQGSRRRFCEPCTAQNKIVSQKSYKKLRKLVLEYYGNKCECCEESRDVFLAIDHVNGGGYEHRKTVKNIYRWLKINNFPEGFRILCYNCNMATYLQGVCPHKHQN